MICFTTLGAASARPETIVFGTSHAHVRQIQRPCSRIAATVSSRRTHRFPCTSDQGRGTFRKSGASLDHAPVIGALLAILIRREEDHFENRIAAHWRATRCLRRTASGASVRYSQVRRLTVTISTDEARA